MKSILICALLLNSLLYSCHRNDSIRKQPTIKTELTQEIIRDTVTNQEGVVLTMTFNNLKQTAALIWQGQTIHLKQDPMASGVKYSNAAYQFIKSHGSITLWKGDDVVFTYRR